MTAFTIPVRHISTGFEGIAIDQRKCGTTREYYVVWDYDGSSGWYNANVLSMLRY
jgi:hypothetical protein